MNYSNDFYSQNTYDNHINFDHVSQQQNLIEALDDLITTPSDEPLDIPDSDDLLL